MKSIDVFCHLMPQKYAELAMNESPNKSHMFVRALKMQAMSDMEYRKQVMEGFEGYKQIPNIVSPPVELFAGPDKSPKLAAIGNDEINGNKGQIEHESYLKSLCELGNGERRNADEKVVFTNEVMAFLRPYAFGCGQEHARHIFIGICLEKMSERRARLIQNLNDLHGAGVRAQSYILEYVRGVHGYGCHDEDRQHYGQAVHNHGRRDLLHAQGITHQRGHDDDLHI